MDWWERRPPEHQDAFAGAHLFVCQHGLWGSPEDVAFLEQYLQHNGWLTLNARSNSARCTFDGADVCGDRLAAEVVSHVQRLAAGGVTVTHISFAAYSFGGLIARYAVGKLLAGGFFSVVAPVNFLTIASPHLGCWEHPSSMSHLAYNSILPWTLSRTGRQLLLADRWLEPEGLPLLAAMARPDLAFHAGLAAFRKRVLLADIRSDRTVPYTTAAITAVNPYLPGGAAAAAPYALSAGGAAGALPSAGGCEAGCGCGCVPRRGFEPLVEVEEGEEEDEDGDEGAGAPAAFCDRLGLGDGDGGGVGAGAGGLLKTWGNTLGLGSVLGFGLSVASLLFGGSGGGGSAGAGGGGGGGRRAWRSAAGAGCGCSGGCCGGAAAAAAAPAVIPLPISSSYPCIVTPHPAPLPAAAPPSVRSAAAAATWRACPVPCGPGASRRLSPTAGAPCALHRSASSPLPKLAGACAADATGDRGGGGGGTSSSRSPKGTCTSSSSSSSSSINSNSVRGRRATAEAHGEFLRHGSDATFSFSVGGCSHRGAVGTAGAAGCQDPPAPSHGLSSSRYGSALYRLHEVRHGRWHVPGSAAALAADTVPVAAAAAARGGRAGGGGGGGDSEDDALASRVRLGLFVALLPVLLSLWLCMVAWLAAIWIHHYAVLLTVRPDRSWDVRMQGPAAATAAGATAATEAPAAGDGDSCSGGGSGSRSLAVPEAAAAAAVAAGRGGGDVGEGDELTATADGGWGLGDGDGGSGYEDGPYDGGEMELCMSLTEAPPPSPPAPLLLQRRRGSLGCGGDDAAAEEDDSRLPRACRPSDLPIGREPRAGAAAAVERSVADEAPPAAMRGVSGAAPTHGSGTTGRGCCSSPFGPSAAAEETAAVAAAGKAAAAEAAPPPQAANWAEADIGAPTESQQPSGLLEEAQGEEQAAQPVYAATAERAAAAAAPDVTAESDSAAAAGDRRIGGTAKEPPRDAVPQASVGGGSAEGRIAGVEAAEPTLTTAAGVLGDAGEEAVRSMVRSLFESVVRRHDGGGGPALAAAEPGAVVLGARAGAEGQQTAAVSEETEADSDRRFVRALTRCIFQGLVARRAASSGKGPVAAATAAAAAAASVGGSDAAAAAVGGDSQSTDLTAAATAQRPPASQTQQQTQQQLQQTQDVDHGLSQNRRVSGAVAVASPGQDGTECAQPRRRGESPPAPEPAQAPPARPPRAAAEGGPPARSHDPAALLSEMIANLNQLEWQKVDVDTRHYHAHAAIVVRSSRRFRSHMHIIDYAVRQLRL